MSKKLCLLIFSVFVLFLVPAAYGVVTGDWERDTDGWATMNDSTYSYSTTGVTLGNWSVHVVPASGAWGGPWLLSMLEEPLLSVFKNNTHFSVNITWVDAEWEGSDFSQIESFVINSEGNGWKQISTFDYAEDTGNPTSPGNPIIGQGVYTTRITWNYSDEVDFSLLPEVPGYVELFMVVQSSGTPIGGYRFDNAHFFNSVNAHYPIPFDTQIHVDVSTDLSWTPGDYAQNHDVYFGTSFEDVNEANNSGDPGATEVYRARQAVGDDDYDIPENLKFGKTYYWRVDEVNDTCAPGLWEGEVWSFTVQCKARNPNPADYEIEVSHSAGLELSWTPGFAGAEHDVYIGTNETEVTNMEADDPDPNDVYRVRRAYDDPNYVVPEALQTGQTYYWRVDEVNDACSLFFKGDVWRFTTINPNARAPYPADESTGIQIHALKLTWTAGPYAASHDVYFGTDYNGVANANDNDTTGIFKGNQPGTEYELSNLDLEATYYWRIDEVNPAYEDQNWPGDVWSFTIPDYITIDDFEYYTISDPEGDAACPYYDGNDLRLDLNNDMRFWWLDGHIQRNPQSNCGSSDYNPLVFDGFLGKLPGSRILRDSGGQTGYGMSYFYDNDDVNNADFPPEQDSYEDHYSEILRYYADGIDLTPDDKVNATFLAIELSYQGQGNNDCDPVYDRMYVGLEDMCSVGPYGQGHFSYIYNPDPNAARKGTWQQWAIELSDFTDENPDLDLNHIKSIRIGFGLQGNTYEDPVGGEGTVIFDDIRVFEHRCVRGEGPVGDISGPEYVPDCVVNVWDLSAFVIDWLLADQTLEYDTIVEPSSPVLWYKFEETEGSVVKNWAPDYDPNVAGDFNGTVENLSDDAWETSGGRDGNGCINLLAGNQTFIYAVPEALNFVSTTNKITFAAWINCDLDNPQDNWNGLFGVWTDNIEIVEVHCPSPSPPIFGFGPSAEWRVLDDWCSYGAPLNAANFSGQWNHYVFTKDADAGTMGLYHNGQLLAEATEVTSPMFETPVSEFYIGARNLWWGWFIGKIDDFQVYDYALSPEEIAYLATDGTGSLYVPLAALTDLHITDPNKIDFGDYAIFAEHWLEEKYWPEP